MRHRLGSCRTVQPVVAFVCLNLAACCLGQNDDEPFLPGLIGHYRSSDGTACDRIDHQLAFDWQQAIPDRRLSGSAWSVHWRGRLQSQAPGEYRIHAYFAGRLQVTLNGQPLLDGEGTSPSWQSSPPIPLAYDAHPIEIRFEKTSEEPRVALYWSGPQFSLEPIDGRQFLHDREATLAEAFDRGASLVRGLRCAACHDLPGEPAPLVGPALDHLQGTIHRNWVVDWLSAPNAPGASEQIARSRRMPHFSLTRDEATEIADWLMAHSQPLAPLPVSPSTTPPPAKSKKKKTADEPEPPPRSPVELGKEHFLTLGCLGCHALDNSPSPNSFDGGNLSAIASKRPAAFFEHWLTAPADINRHHRMPIFDLTVAERRELSAFLQTQGNREPMSTANRSEASRGPTLLERNRCHACHALPREFSTAPGKLVRTKLAADSNWSRSCIESRPSADRPQFIVAERDQQAIRAFIGQLAATDRPRAITGKQFLEEKNCLSCHQRDGMPGLAPRLTSLAADHPVLAPRIPSMTPPALNSVGDKLTTTTLHAALARTGPPHRPYLSVRMPRFPLAADESTAMVSYFLASDRIPEGGPTARETTASIAAPGLLDAVGSRLVTPDGFGCTSCHQVGDVLPANAPLNARGPTLSLLGTRIRREWYDRWVRNPSRIVPRMEMPSVQIPVRGVLADNLDNQLAAVWEVLNKPGFQPPQPNPVRVVRHSGTALTDRAVVVTDVVRAGTDTLIKPLLIGLANRHNVLFDLESARLASWSVGDTARQRTEGKSWHWEFSGQELLRSESGLEELSVIRSGTEVPVRLSGQFITEFDELAFADNGLRVQYRLHYENRERPLFFSQEFRPMVADDRSGFVREIEVTGLQSGDQLRFRVASLKPADQARISVDHRALDLAQPLPIRIVISAPSEARFDRQAIVVEAVAGTARLELHYSTSFPVDRFLVAAPPLAPIPVQQLDVLPGFAAWRLPLAEDIMPTALAWRPDGVLVVGSLKGQVWQVHDTNGDGLGDRAEPLVDGLAAPYGLFATEHYVDVANKYAVLRLFDPDQDGRADRVTTLASGWGHTADYHDWAVGLPRSETGHYYLAVPCQQDQRSVAAARHRGELLELVPRQATADDPRRYGLETVSRGHRFPMGIARRRDGQLFVTDNQGNYNPFNELNHIRPGAHYGFINALEKDDPAPAPLVPPAIDLPHPWVRSVNGICFLETPAAVGGKSSQIGFGPFEGHLIGCEMDTRRLIRMSLQTVGETVQGAAYPFSYDQPPDGPPLLGPLVCAVSPLGELYIGGLRDSGWGGANNIGELVRLQFQPDQLPCGIAEVRVVARGFEIDFTRPVDRARAALTANYSVASYTRESTPAYGGPDLNRRTEGIRAVDVSADGRRATLQLGNWRPGYVYELHVRNLTARESVFFPAEAHYTLNAIPVLAQ